MLAKNNKSSQNKLKAKRSIRLAKMLNVKKELAKRSIRKFKNYNNKRTAKR